MTTILIIEDEPELLRVLRSYLEQAGFAVLTATRGDSGLSMWQHKQPDLVILDLNLPGMDGLDVAREIRRKSNMPIMMLTARVEEADQLVGLELGADDYLLKPFSPRIVVARVRALLRRTEILPLTHRLRVADVEIDLDAHLVTRDQQNIDLTPTEFNLLVALVSQPGRVFNRSQLLEVAQGVNTEGVSYEGYERAIDAHVKNLRAKLEPNPKKPRYIETVFGVGYRFGKG